MLAKERMMSEEKEEYKTETAKSQSKFERGVSHTPYYEKDGIALYQADSFEFLRDLKQDSVDLVLTDPPYKVSQKYGGGVDADNLMAVASIHKTFPELSRVLKPSNFAVVCYDNRILPLVFEAAKGTDLIYRKQIFLYRRWGIANRWVGWMQTTDPVCIFVNGHEKPFAPAIKGKVKHDCYIKASPEAESTGHPAQKPLDFMMDIITWCSNEGDVVIDPYAGSGTTLLAAKRLGRRAIGIEKEARYCDMIIDRLEKPQEELF